jgi:hypothetical protein
MCSAILAAQVLCTVPALAADNGNGNSQGNNSQGNNGQGKGNSQGPVDTIPAGATGRFQHGVDPAKGGPKTSQPKNLIDHGGPVRAASHVYFIWWGPPASFPSDAMNGLTSIAQNMNGTSYLGITQQYMRNVPVSTAFANQASDFSAPPTRSPSTSAIVNEACKVITENKWTPDPTALYTVVTSNFPKNVNYCAWHSHGNCNGTDISVAYLPNASGVAGCDPGNQLHCNDTVSQGTRSMADSYAHEFAETITDPDLNAWYDSGGNEIGDKCDFMYSACVSLGTNKWQLQQLWSNAASACVQQ